jgi:hypothetical protein
MISVHGASLFGSTLFHGFSQIAPKIRVYPCPSVSNKVSKLLRRGIILTERKSAMPPLVQKVTEEALGLLFPVSWPQTQRGNGF